MNNNKVAYLKFNIMPTADGFKAYCETARKVIEPVSASGSGATPMEAVQNAYNQLIEAVKERREDEAFVDELEKQFRQTGNNED